MKSIKSIAIFLILVFIIVIGITLISSSQPDKVSEINSIVNREPSVNPVTTPVNNPPEKPAVKTYTLREVATHSNSASCWTIVNSNVYNLTNWINQHPGGPEAILGICGKDATLAFEAQHGGQRRPETELAKYKIGAYAK